MKLKEIQLGVAKKLMYIRHGKYLECDILTQSIEGRWTTRTSFSLSLEDLQKLLKEFESDE